VFLRRRFISVPVHVADWKHVEPVRNSGRLPVRGRCKGRLLLISSIATRLLERQLTFAVIQLVPLHTGTVCCGTSSHARLLVSAPASSCPAVLLASCCSKQLFCSTCYFQRHMKSLGHSDIQLEAIHHTRVAWHRETAKLSCALN
jgi:hypothetical protein